MTCHTTALGDYACLPVSLPTARDLSHHMALWRQSVLDFSKRILHGGCWRQWTQGRGGVSSWKRCYIIEGKCNSSSEGSGAVLLPRDVAVSDRRHGVSAVRLVISVQRSANRYGYLKANTRAQRGPHEHGRVAQAAETVTGFRSTLTGFQATWFK